MTSSRERGVRVAVTGMGVISPLGNSLPELLDGLARGRSGIRSMPEWDAIQGLDTRVAGICGNLEEDAVPRKSRRTMGRVAVLAALAAQSAISDAGLEARDLEGPHCGVSFGSTTGSSITQEKYLAGILTRRNLRGVLASEYVHFMSHTCAANLAVLLGTEGPVVASCTACVSGSQGIGYGFEQILLGNASIMVCGGAEEMHFMDAVVFDVMRATSTRYNDRPAQTPRPFDRDRDGLVVAEGGGCLVLEEWGRARKRGARIYAEVLSFGNNCDGTHVTSSNPDGIAAAIQGALKKAELPPEAIGYINAHATGTQVGDAAEAEATHRIFGTSVPVSSLKGHLGHTLGASGAIESAATLGMMHQGFAAPTLNLENPDPACSPLDHITGGPRELRFDVAMNNNFAFGGLNTSLIFRKA